jgi:hypothetical protein
MVKDLMIDIVNGPKTILQAPFWRKFALPWQGPKPSLAMRYKFFKDTQLTVSPNSYLKLLNFDSLKYIQKQTSFFSQQVIKENEAFDHDLLKKSWTSLYPHEVTLINITNSQGEVFTSSCHHGGPYRGASLKNLRKEIGTLCFAARKKGLSVEEIQIVHTHPTCEVMIVDREDENKSSFIFNGLSRSDINLAKALAPFVPYPLRIKAITPAANYSMLF